MFKILDKVCTPTKGTKYSACVDLFAAKDVVVGAGETVLVPLGVKIDLEKLKENYIKNNKLRDEKAGLPPLSKTFENKYFNEEFLKSHQLNLHIRSSMSAKHGLIIANGTGIIDLDYPGEIMICLHNPIVGATSKQVSPKTEKITTFNCCSGDKNRYAIKKGQPIAQISLVEHKTYLLGVGSEEKRIGGFGSTNV